MLNCISHAEKKQRIWCTLIQQFWQKISSDLESNRPNLLPKLLMYRNQCIPCTASKVNPVHHSLKSETLDINSK